MKISKIVYLSLLLIIVSLIFAFCLKILFFSSTNKSILETNTKYFDEVYSEYKKRFIDRKTIFKHFSLLFCNIAVNIYWLWRNGNLYTRKNPMLIENFMLESSGDFLKGFDWLFELDEDLFYKKEDQSVFTEIFEDSKSQIRTGFKNIEKSIDLEDLNKLRNNIKAIFESTSLNTQHLQNLLYLFDIYITNEDVLIKGNSILMKPALLYAMDFIELNWLKNLSTDMTKNILSSEFTTPEGTFSYLYISLYRWVQSS